MSSGRVKQQRSFRHQNNGNQGVRESLFSQAKSCYELAQKLQFGKSLDTQLCFDSGKSAIR